LTKLYNAPLSFSLLFLNSCGPDLTTTPRGWIFES